MTVDAAPDVLSTVLAGFEARTDAFTPDDVGAALTAVVHTVTAPSVAERAAGAAELIAFGVRPWPNYGSPWGTYFGPTMSAERADGSEVHFPDIAQANVATVEHWRARAIATGHPVLKARYADLAWDLGPQIAPAAKRDGGSALLAVDAYLAAALLPGHSTPDALDNASRALALAIAINNPIRRDAARALLLKIDADAKANGEPWTAAYDILLGQPKCGLTPDEKAALVADLETALARYADTSVAASLDPHHVQAVAERLLIHYRKLRQSDDERRVHGVVAKVTEHFASLGNALLASSILNQAMGAYQAAGQPEEAERIRRLLVTKVHEANAEMKPIRTEMRISFDEIAAFKAEIVAGSPSRTVARIAWHFLLKKKELEDLLEQQKASAPLMSHLTQTIMGDDYQVASIGSVDDDPLGRVLRQAALSLQIHTPWLSWALDAMHDTYKLQVGDFVGWSNRAGLFDDGVLLAAGIEAWMGGDDLKAIHILIPQIERGLRNLADRVGRPSTKPHPHFKGAQVAISMGDIVFNHDTIAAFGPQGPDLAVHLAALYADPRSMNLRNELAHGLLDWRAMHSGTLLWVVHTLLVLGLWRSPADDKPADFEMSAGGV
jgi:lysyl-tRNA synthetase class 1